MNLSRRSLLLGSLGLLVLASTSDAAGTALVSVRVPGEAKVSLTGPDGRTVSQVTATGEAFLTPKSAGPHRITVTVGGKAVTGEVLIPAAGQARIIFDPSRRTPFESYISDAEAVTVIAESVDEALQKAPAAITVLDRRQLEIRNIENLQQASYATPNFWMEKSEGTSSGARAAIRGVGEDESFFTSEIPVAIYVNDVYIPHPTGALFDLYDIERLEILRGPQGTRFGRNSSAGALRLITLQPGNRVQARLEGALGSFRQTDLRGSLSLPAGEKVGLVFAGLVRKHEGYDTNIVNHSDVNDQDVRAGRVAVRIMPTPAFNAVVNLDTIRERSTPGYAVALDSQPPLVAPWAPFPETASGFGVGKTDLGPQLDGDAHTLQSDLLDPRNHIDQNSYSATLGYTLGHGMTLKSITAYRTVANELLFDADGGVGNYLGITHLTSEAPAFHLYQLRDQNHFSQEFQLSGRSGRAHFLTGVYYLRSHNDQTTENVVFNPLGDNKHWTVREDIQSYAAYGSLTYAATSRLSLTAGARVTTDDKDFLTRVFFSSGDQMMACANALGEVTPEGSVRPCNEAAPEGFTTTPVEKRLNRAWTGLTPRFAVDYTFQPNAMVYGSYNRGFKSGKFDGGANSAASVLALQPLSPETVDSLEAGVKSDLARGKARINASVFMNRWKNLQGTGVDLNGNFYRTTLGDVTTEGVELETRLGPFAGFEIFGQAARLSTRYERIAFDQAGLCGNVNTARRRLELKMSPPYSYQVGVLHSTPVHSGRLVVSGILSGRGHFWHTTCNADPGSEDGFKLVDASVAFESRDNRWRVAVTGENLADEKYLIGSFTVAVLHVSSGYLNPPRRLGLKVRYAFD